MSYAHLAAMKRALMGQPVTTLERMVLQDMATALPQDSYRYDWGWERLALAIGKDITTKAATKSLDRIIASLITKGFIERTRNPSRHVRAEYLMLILLPRTVAEDVAVDNSAEEESMHPGPETLCTPVQDVYAPRSDRGAEDPVKNQGEERPPACRRHPSGWKHDDPCRACADLRHWQEFRPTVSQMQTVRPGHHCAPGAHRLVADGSCMYCDERAVDIADENYFRPAALVELEARL